MPYPPVELMNHTRRVCALYKRALRTIESYYSARQLVRYQSVILRAEFDKHKCQEDPKEQRRLLWSGEHELFLKMHPIPVAKFATSLGIAGGVAYAREVEPPDWVLDYWHPLEKAQYPTYFRNRECKKAEYIKLWESGKMF